MNFQDQKSKSQVLDNLIGLPLEVGHAELLVAGFEVNIIETRARPSKVSQPMWGEMRVLRARMSEDTGGVAELLVGLEMLGETRLGETRLTRAGVVAD